MADASKLRGDVKWWEDELRSCKGKVDEAERMLRQREGELERAEREEQEAERKKQADSKKK